MARIIGRPKIELELAFVIDEEEARALDALAGYGDDSFIKVFYEKLGVHYMKPHEQGLRRFLQTIRGVVSGELKKVDQARDVFTGEKKAVHK
jgi:sarcosine oxidase delta subunit